MKKNLVKVLTLALAAATVAGMSAMPVFAVNTVTDTWTVTEGASRGTITVQGVKESGVTVTAYQIVKGVYSEGKLNDYALCDANFAKIADVMNPTADEVTTIANNINAKTTTLNGVTMKKSGNDYVADVELGLYIVLVTGADTTVYNPALVAVNAEDPINGSVDMTLPFTGSAYVKSSETGFNKDIIGSSKPTEKAVSENPKNSEGDTVAFGDKVYFKIDEMTIPSYSQDYTAVQYTIEDTLENGPFLGINNLVVTVGGAEVAAADDTYTLYYNGAKVNPGTAGSSGGAATSFKVEFADAYIRANGNKKVEITYDSVFTENATVNYAENKNTATLTYSNNPEDATKTKTLTDTTYHYTFGIDADIDAEAPGDDGDQKNKDKETFELNKVTEAVGGGSFAEYRDDGLVTMRNDTYKLQGAKFGLYTDKAMTVARITPECDDDGYVTSDENGHITFTGLDEGTYYMKETVAPATYSLNDKNTYKIVIAADLDAEGVMTAYSITTYLSTDGGATYDETAPVGSARYTNTGYSVNKTTGEVTNALSDYTAITPVEIVNPKLAGLPSTGGAGTIAITIGAGIGMAGFLTLYIINKKKKDDEAE